MNTNMGKGKQARGRPIAIDLFSGAGGMSLGFEQAGFDIAFSIDYDPYHVAAHKRNFPYGEAICGSVSDLKASDVRKVVGDREIDLLFGGPPCQGFSHMGHRDTLDPRNTLVREFVRLVSELEPKTFVMENVPGMKSGKAQPVFDDAIDLFKKAGYRITWPVQVLNAKDYGVPQDRRRLFVLGVRADISKEIEYPSPLSKTPTVWDAIGDLPQIEKYERLVDHSTIPYDKEPKSKYALLARGVERDERDLSRPRIWQKEICTCSQQVKHSPPVISLYDATPPGRMVPGHKLPRLDPKGVSPTLRAGSNSERGSHTAPRPVHPFLPRCITAREAARLHGFPDWFVFYPGKWHSYQQIGNAVCPPVAKAIGHQIRRALGLPAAKNLGEAITLNDVFPLSEDRPKTHRRLTHAEELPKIVEWLFDKAFDPITNRLKKKLFTSEDIEKAISATGANVPRIRPDQIVLAVARSRNVNQILAKVHAAGFTLRAVNEIGGGEFIPVGSEGSVTEKDSIMIRSSEVLGATKLRVPSFPDSSASLARLVEEVPIAENLSRNEWRDFTLEQIQRNGGDEVIWTAALTERKGKKVPTMVMASLEGGLPRPSRVQALLKEYELSHAVVLTKLTDRHVMAVALQTGVRAIEERQRMVFELQAGSQKRRSTPAQLTLDQGVDAT